MIVRLAGCVLMILFAAIGSRPAGAEPASPPAASVLPRHIPTAELARPSLVSSPQLSPDGTRVLARFNIDGKEMLGVHSLTGEKLRLFSLPPKKDLASYRWAGNDRILISLGETVPWYDDDAYATRLGCYELATSTFRFIGSKTEGLEGDDILYVDPSGEWILLSFQPTIYDWPTVSRVELATNKIKQVVGSRPGVWEWYADLDGVVRAGVGQDDKGWSMVYRRAGTDPFRRLPKVKWDDEDAALDIVRFTRASDEGYVLSNKATGRYALYKYNYATKTLGEPIFKNDTNDITDFQTTLDGDALQAVWYTDDRDRIVWFDEKMKAVQAELDAAVKQNENWIVSRSRDDKVMLVWTGASDDPGSLYVHRPEEGTMVRITKLNDKIARKDLARTSYVHYKARDGLEIPAYLTLPLGRDPKGLPLIIMPHGGPYDVRDNADYNADVQFLANRGYAVLQPNFRGSGGYGRDFYAKGEGQWGRKMQDDLDDGMDWLAHDGIIDPKRVCLIGSSYGGYAALWGAHRNPERYRCAASYAGVSDLGKQLKYQISFRINRRYRKDWRQTVLGTENFDTTSVSPLYAAASLKVPVLLMHGDADQTVPYKQSKSYADALKAAGKIYEFYSHADEGHGFTTGANFQDWLDRLDAFLTRYNPS
jgi:dipeptidyl aminopeptidase/acylaminoacyl peptidase